jgi:predicted RNase H-like HicB family nuclease
MKTYYAAGFVLEADGKYSVYFPDILGCYTWGENLAHATEAASDALSDMLGAIAAANGDVPQPSRLEDVRKKVQEIRRMDGLPCPKDTVYQLVAAPCLDPTPVRVNVSIPRGALAEIDKKAKALGYTRSGYLVHSALHYDAR